MKRTIITSILTLLTILCMAQAQPECLPAVVYHLDDRDVESADTVASAPIYATLHANPENVEGRTVNYTWCLYKNSLNEAAYLTRYDEDTDVTFNESGTHLMQLTLSYYDEYNNEIEIKYDPLRIIITESKLEFPNAFSPNGDGINDIYKAKDGWQSIVEFHGTIFNRWGQKLFEWDNPDEGWDGTYNGKDVKQGVYYMLVRARGADGVKFEFKRDVNLLRGFTKEGEI